jgi:putative drug exporter of the RND superfamily
MAFVLQRLGRFAFVHRRVVLGFWLLAVAGLALLLVQVHTSFDSQFTIPGTSSQHAIDQLAQVTPSARGGSGSVVLDAPTGHSLNKEGTRAAVERSVEAAGHTPGVVSVSDPYATGGISSSGQIARVSVTFRRPSGSVTSPQRSALADAFAPARSSGLRTYFGGDAAAPLATGSTEALGVLVALIVLVITFGSLLSAGMPLMGAILGVAIGLLGVGVVNSVLQLNSAASTLASMLGLAVGIDYALFIITRYRSTVRALSTADGGVGSVDLTEAIGTAVATAGSAVVFAGSTVVIALSALIICGIPFLTEMGLAGAGTIMVAMLIALTLIPALLGFAGPRAFKGKMIDAGPTAARPTAGHRWVGVVTRHRVPAAVVVIVILAALSIPVLGMRQGLPTDGGAPTSTTQRHAYDLITRGFGPGANGPLLVVATVPSHGGTAAATRAASQLEGLTDVTDVSPPTIQPGGRLATITVTPASGPSSSATSDLVHAIRDSAATIASRTGVGISVTGVTATNVDVSQRVSSALLPYLLVVMGLALFLLMIAFRSILVPLTALLGFLLTIGASLGTVVLVFQHGLAKDIIGVPRAEPVLSFLPILAIGVLFGLAMDYEVFLVSRMREERSEGAAPGDAVTNGFTYGARVVTAAALIMIGVFASFVTTSDPTVKSIGFVLATGVFFDAFLVRLTLIPALMSMLGDRVWHLPHWLDRVLPHVDLEGASLRPGPRPSQRVGRRGRQAADAPAG